MKKGQAAMEFLMTYGWAILVVLVAIGALAYFGVLSPGRFLPNSCTIIPGLSCDEFKIDDNAPQAIFIIRNGLGTDIAANSILSVDCDGTPSTLSTATNTSVWNDGDQISFSVTCATATDPWPTGTTAGDRFNSNDNLVTLTYSEAGVGLSHTINIDLVTEVE